MKFLSLFQRLFIAVSIILIEHPAACCYAGIWHSSRFDYKVLHFFREKSIHLIIMSPDTTGVAQSLDQSLNRKCSMASHRFTFTVIREKCCYSMRNQ